MLTGIHPIQTAYNRSPVSAIKTIHNEGDLDVKSVPDLPAVGCSHSLVDASTDLN
jgi:hypothetical protein